MDGEQRDECVAFERKPDRVKIVKIGSEMRQLSFSVKSIGSPF